jgi:hypothetical protein
MGNDEGMEGWRDGGMEGWRRPKNNSQRESPSLREGRSLSSGEGLGTSLDVTVQVVQTAKWITEPSAPPFSQAPA